MNQTRNYFTQDELLLRIRENFSKGLHRSKVPECSGSLFSNVDCLMSGLALFSFKFSSLLKFDKARGQDVILSRNLKILFQLQGVPCDTYMRERLDVIDPRVTRMAFCNLFTLLQRNKILDHYRFFGDHYLVSVDGTGVFSSNSVHCDHCCIKNHRNGTITYHHQILAAALVHPDQKVVFPFAPEPIMKTDGAKKNDCERNALKRWVKDFRREHPHLKVITLLDGLSANEPCISLLKAEALSFIIVCKTKDHAYLGDWLKAADKQDKPSFTDTVKGVKRTYAYMRDVPLNDAKQSCRVTVVNFSETKGGKTTNWTWVTDLPVDLKNIREFVKGARARWKIENETFNTLKNQGYEFEHNFGHGKQHLNTVFAHLMLLAFFVDQCLQQVNKRFQAALLRCGGKSHLWERMLNSLYIVEIPSFESLYYHIVHPPSLKFSSVI